MINIESYKGPDNCGFGCSQEEVINCFGKPKLERKNRSGGVEYHYDGFIIRFDTTTFEFKEFTLIPETGGTINGELIGWTLDDFKRIIKIDSNPVDVFGFIVLFDLGMALTGFHDGDDSQKAIHFFRRGDWDKFKPDMKPFNIT